MSQQRKHALTQDVVQHKSAILIAATVIVLSFFLHLKWCGSAMQYSEDLFAQILNGHKIEYPFCNRFMTTYALMSLNALGLTVKQSFFILQYVLVSFLALFFYRFLMAMNFPRNRANLGLFLFLSSYPILAAHIAPVHTWDDFWAHLFTLLAFTAAMRAKLSRGVAWFTLACFAREQSFILLPALVFSMRLFNPHLTFRRLVGLTAIPIVLYGAFLTYNWQAPEPERLTLILKNFETPLRSSDTLYSLFISFGFAWVTAGIGLARGGQSRIARFLRWGTALTLPTTLVFTLLLTNARETRILFPPFLFVLPMAAIIAHGAWSSLKTRLKPYGATPGMFITMALMTTGIILGYVIFPKFEYRQCPDFHRLWAGIHLGIIFLLGAYTIRWGWRNITLDDDDARAV